jgi:hypothetical protein
MRAWHAEAKDLLLGQQLRYRHDCGFDKDAIVSHQPEGYSLHCFKCGEHHFRKKADLTLLELAEIREFNRLAIEEQHNAIISLPTDYQTAIPHRHTLWLLKAGIPRSEYMAMGIGWSPRLHRIIIPVNSSTGDLLYWQGRAVDQGQIPKYINPRADKTSLLYARAESNSRARVVVTEDILSAIRVGRHIPAVSILGTATSHGQAIQLSRYRRVTYWLDPDKAGRRGATKGHKQLSLLTNCDVIHSDKDPKNLPDRVIREYLCLPYTERYNYIGPIDTETTQTQRALQHPSAITAC